jgi:uncharacterized protein
MSRALIIFAKLPRVGEVKTRLGASIGMQKAAEVYADLARHVFDIATELAALETRVYLMYAPGVQEADIVRWVERDFIFREQRGETLGDRMRDAFELVFQEGAKESVIIGTDIPDLSVRVIQEAFSHLATHEVVIGPSADGGYYLLGLSVPDRDIFDAIPWSTDAVLRDTVTKLQHLGRSYAMLEVLTDVDHVAEYEAYLARKEQ